MQNSFPGMNPYLEQPGLWPQVHNRLTVAIADAITPQVAPKYRVSIEERVYTSAEVIPLIGIADVAIARRDNPASLKTYNILVSRSVDRPNAALYEFDLKDSMPSFPMPLSIEDGDAIVPLQALLNDVYTRARFDLAINYNQPLKLGLSGEDATWLKQVLKSCVEQ